MPRQKLAKPVRIPEAPVFTAFDDPEDFWVVPGYERNLPHWRLTGATYFVTFRLADSIPQEVAERWQKEQSQWLFSHGIDLHWRKSDPERFRQAIGALDPASRAAFEHEMSRQFFIELDRCHGCCALRNQPA
ncbi:MAG: hypothetical protein ACKVY0_12110 [Prosthecobacter sp.]|uniref:hypothetical protein n=1 Tax=Prosthecobacter sp. TaxID=1965333 RepID=UPI0038FF9EB7